MLDRRMPIHPYQHRRHFYLLIHLTSKTLSTQNLSSNPETSHNTPTRKSPRLFPQSPLSLSRRRSIPAYTRRIKRAKGAAGAFKLRGITLLCGTASRLRLISRSCLGLVELFYWEQNASAFFCLRRNEILRFRRNVYWKWWFWGVIKEYGGVIGWWV